MVAYHLGRQIDDPIPRTITDTYELPPVDIIGTGVVPNKSFAMGPAGFNIWGNVNTGVAGVQTRKSAYTQPLQSSP